MEVQVIVLYGSASVAVVSHRTDFAWAAYFLVSPINQVLHDYATINSPLFYVCALVCSLELIIER